MYGLWDTEWGWPAGPGGFGNGAAITALAQELDAAAGEADRLAAEVRRENDVRWHSEAAEAFRDKLAESVAAVRAAADALQAASAAVHAYAQAAEGPG